MEMYILRQLAAFADAGTLSRVAEELNTSQPAISRSMQKLEDELEVPLFERSKNRIALNRFGKLAAEHAKKIVEAHDKMMEEVREEFRNSRLFAYGSIAPFPIYELSPVIGQLFMGAEIQTELSDTERPLVEGLDAGRFRFVVLRRPLEDKRYFCQKLFREKLSALLPKGHRLARRKSIHLSDLAGENILIHTKIGFWYSLCKEKIPGANFLGQDELSALREIVRATDLPAFVTNLSYRSPEILKNKTAVPIDDEEADVTFYFVCLKQKRSELEALFSQVKALSEVYG